MLGRGVDRILAHPGDDRLYEAVVRSAETYVRLAETVSGPIPRRVDPTYVWGEALDALREVGPDARVVNLETSVTRSAEALPKGINYKMSPDNVECLTAARVDVCAIANNHVLDWGRRGLLETLTTLHGAGVRTAGAGRNAAEARTPAVLEMPGKGRVLVFGYGCESSGIPRAWAAGGGAPGVNLLADLSEDTALRVAEHVAAVREPGDVVVASIHWGGNWGYQVTPAQRSFAHLLVDRAGIDVLHGHSSHHPRPIEVYRDRLLLYGCGDFVNDYEGITGNERYRGDLVFMYLPTLDVASGRLVGLRLIPFQLRKFRLSRAGAQDAAWLHRVLERESARFGTRIRSDGEGALSVTWPGMA